ncbi:uncharacterized protein PHACADRAFT_212832 [Phanerochaete carnosa HHB-10118-sp]|uniref:Glucose-methanol-choline oxidoreductase N-terminal domain-containing protein n=1 Tax=Phanerochaete carnosa (strain HHB-10118-sp) TaxID=650164 RepID=K5VVT6_PHACS|nr:uncharacterized protein PHACADRAFT_212832 [Phanerochaete carnosa HHB-10118-sp]EKM50915.1 hypothetical protein PHACADRAFT_212832 [Phanerochaete carnosa HHB-10118-sp]
MCLSAFKTLLLLISVVQPALVLANTACPAEVPALVEAEPFSQTIFDYIVIGGGTAGVALSARLSEDPSLVVGLIEAGTTHFSDPVVDAAGNSPVGNSSYDWLFLSTPQVNAANQTISLPRLIPLTSLIRSSANGSVSRGKMLGGSSGINSMAWCRASSAEYDSWDSFAPNQGWTWSGLLPVMKKTETLSLLPRNPYPGISQQAAEKTLADLTHVDGFSGPINASHTPFYFETVPSLVKSLNGLGIETNPEPQGGNATGITDILLSFDPKHGTRSYSAVTYFCSHSQNPNYHVLLDAQATKILFSETDSGLTATGVQFISGNKTYIANATCEVILSAGTDQTPQLLELSGIGNSSILSAYDINPLVDLPGVGENFQEHPVVSVQFELIPDINTFDILRNNATFAAQQEALYAKNHTGLLTATDNTAAFVPLAKVVDAARLDDLLDIFDQSMQQGLQTGVQQQQAKFIRQWISEDSVGSVEIIGWSRGVIDPAANKSYVTLINALLHPLSRGSVHIASSDPLAPPAINPNFLAQEFDVQVLVDILKYAQKIGQTEPFASLVAAQTNPSMSAQTDDDLIAYIRSSVQGEDHHIGTAAMAPRELGGVVDGTLKVYGTTNLRVVDASIFPNHIGAHTQATVYAIAEKAADIIRSG